MARKVSPLVMPDWFLHLALIFLHCLAAFGGLLILYSLTSELLGQPWGPIELIAEQLSASLTLIGTGFTAASIYAFGVPMHRAHAISRYFTAPVVLVLVGVALVWTWIGEVPPTVINGFSAVGLSGALFRIIPLPTYLRPKESEETNSV